MTPPATPADEIDALLARLGASSCEFERNDSWHDAAAARSHLQRKLDYARKRGLAGTAEEFIAGAATKSSLSGKPYRVRCAGQPPQPAATWFTGQLRALRSAH